MKYFVRTKRATGSAGPFDLERARARLRATLSSERGRGNAVHEGQRGIWLIAQDGGGAGLFWIADELEGIVRLDDRGDGPPLLQ
jgi:hypothetical protein